MSKACSLLTHAHQYIYVKKHRAYRVYASTPKHILLKRERDSHVKLSIGCPMKHSHENQTWSVCCCCCFFLCSAFLVSTLASSSSSVWKDNRYTRNTQTDTQYTNTAKLLLYIVIITLVKCFQTKAMLISVAMPNRNVSITEPCSWRLIALGRYYKLNGRRYIGILNATDVALVTTCHQY